MRCVEVFISNGSADRGLVDADDIGDLRHRERLELGDAVIKKLTLSFEDFTRDFLDRALSLLNRIDQKFTRFHSFF